MLASYQFVPSKMSDQNPQKMGGGFKIRYRSAYPKSKQSLPLSGKRKIQKPKLTQHEINEAMNQLLDRNSPTSNRRNVITKPVGGNLELDFQKMASAAETVQHALELLSAIQKKLPAREEDKSEGPISGVLSDSNSNRQIRNLAKYQTAEAVPFMSNATLQQTPDSSVTPGRRINLEERQRQAKRPFSGINQSGVNGRIIDIEKLATVNQHDQQRKACGTLTPDSDLNIQEKSAKILNNLLEIQSSEKFKSKLVKSNSSLTKNADLLNILEDKEAKLKLKVAEVTRKDQLTQQLQLQPDFGPSTMQKFLTPLSAQEQFKIYEQEQPLKNAIASQTPNSNQFPQTLVSERQIGYPALISNKTNFSQLAWNISLMRQDSYDPTNSRERLNFHQSEQALQILNAKYHGQTRTSPTFEQNELSNNFDERIVPGKFKRPVTSRPALVNLMSHKNIEMTFKRQIQEREMLKTLSTAQINKLSVGALKVPNENSATKVAQSSASNNVKMQHSESSRVQQVHLDVQTCRDQPVKVKFMLSQINEASLQAQPLFEQTPDEPIYIQGLKMKSFDTFDDKLNLASSQKASSSRTHLSRFSKNNLRQHVYSDRNLISEVGQEDLGQNQMSTHTGIKSRIQIKSKQSGKTSPQSKYEITKHLDHNFKEVETFKKVPFNQDLQQQVATLDLKTQIGQDLSAINHKQQQQRTSTALEIDPSIKQDQYKQEYQLKLLPNTTFSELYQQLPSDQFRINELTSNLLSIGNIQESRSVPKSSKMSLSPKQKKSFTSNIAQLAKMISAQSQADQEVFQVKYTNLMEKHTKKSWLPEPNTKGVEKQETKKKVPQSAVSGKTQETKCSAVEKAHLGVKSKAHPLAFLQINTGSKNDQPFLVIKRTADRPKTSKSTCRIALIQQKDAPLPPPSAKELKRVGADINFLRWSQPQPSLKSKSGLALIDIQMSNLQLVLKTSKANAHQEQMQSRILSAGDEILQVVDFHRPIFDHQMRKRTVSSNLFGKAASKVA